MSGAAPRRVGLNLLWLVPGVVGGSEEYTIRLLHALAERDADDLRLTVFANSLVAAAYPELGEWFEVVVAPVTGRSKPLRVGAETSWLGWESRRRHLDLVHHMGGILPAWRPTETVLTIHDLQPLAMPEFFSPTKRRFHHLVIPRSVRAARTIVTLTEFTRWDMVARLGADPDRIVVVPPGFDPPPALADDASDEVRERYRLGDAPFFLFPAITYPHKNHLLLLEAFARVHRAHPEVRLVLTGGSAQCEHDVRAAIVRLGLFDAVRRTGRIPAADLDALYRSAAALTFPSLYEGFGLPVLEAMARDCPVIAARATALPEVVGEAGLLVTPDDPEEWSDAMAQVLEDRSLTDRLRVAGRERAHSFDWVDTAEVLEDVYRSERGR